MGVFPACGSTEPVSSRQVRLFLFLKLAPELQIPILNLCVGNCSNPDRLRSLRN